jgi:hypothetical protein
MPVRGSPVGFRLGGRKSPLLERPFFSSILAISFQTFFVVPKKSMLI